MMCQACENGEHWNCRMQTWCECECDPEAALAYFPPDPMEQADDQEAIFDGDL